MEYGICRLSVIPVRSEPSDKAELCTQLLFGESYVVNAYDEARKWVKIETILDQYTGWISALQHFSTDESYHKTYVAAKHPVCTGLINFAGIDGSNFVIAPGSILPFYKDNQFKIGSKEYSFQGEADIERSKLKDWKRIAKMYLKTPYLWGGKTPLGIDCSGFTQQVFRLCGHNLSRDAYQQALQGKPVLHLEEAQPGDLVFFDNDKGRIIHVGIILEDNQVIHASGEVRIDKLDTQGIWNTSRQLYTHKLSNIRRVLE